jgi:hypothetical protein
MTERGDQNLESVSAMDEIDKRLEARDAQEIDGTLGFLQS